MRSFRLALIGLFIVAGVVGCAEDDRRITKRFGLEIDPWVGKWKQVPAEDEDADGWDDETSTIMTLERDNGGALVGSTDTPEREFESYDGSVHTADRHIIIFDEITELKNTIRIRHTSSEIRVTITLNRQDARTLEGVLHFGESTIRTPVRYERVP